MQRKYDVSKERKLSQDPSHCPLTESREGGIILCVNS